MKQGSFFSFVCHFDFSQTMALHVVLLVSLESSLNQWIGVHGTSCHALDIFGKLSQWIGVHGTSCHVLDIFETENCVLQFGSVLGVVGKPLVS